jgi:phage anti-repressor protein
MEELVKIRKSARTGNPIVNARDLYKGLKVGKDFSTWIKEKIEKCEFIENVDYARIFFDENGKKMTLPKNGERSSRGFGDVFRIEYALTFNSAKHIAMLQNNAQGKKVRQYFIDREKDFWVLKEELNRKPELSYSVGEVAKMLNLTDYYGKIGRNSLYNILYFNKIVDEKNRAVKKYVKKGYFTNYPTRVTVEGLEWLRQRFRALESQSIDTLMKMVEDLRAKQLVQEQRECLLVQGVTSVVETLLFNKGGSKTEEQNRIAISHLSGYLENAKKMPKALN